MNPIIIGLIDGFILFTVFFKHLVNALAKAEASSYGFRIKKFTPLFDDEEFRSCNIDNTNIFNRIWTMIIFFIFGHMPMGMDVPMRGLYETYDGSMILSKDSPPNISMARRTTQVYLANINDNMDFSRFVNSLAGSLTRDNNVLLSDLIKALSNYYEKAELKDLVVALSNSSANLTVTDVTSKDFNEFTFGPNDIIVL